MLGAAAVSGEKDYCRARDHGVGTYDGVVTTDGAWLRGEGVGGTEDLAAGLDGVTALPDHGADGSAAHVGNQSREEGLLGEIGIVLLKVLLGGGGELDGGKLEATGLEAGDDGADEATLDNCQHALDTGCNWRGGRRVREEERAE